ncbi:MAG: phosphatase PAP2 family protein [Oscillospiraceae bacterium]|nr:phosphatase PAP2 family protein [Oscillospiraceae bacterium]
MKKTRGPLVPRYAYAPLAAAAILNLAVFYGTRPLTAGRTHYELAIALDGRIPFWPVFVVFYVLAFLQWPVGYIMAARENRALCYDMVSGDIIAKLLCMACFLALPTAITRPALGGGFWDRLVGIIYFFDSPDNCFPSIHCLESWLCARMALKGTRTPRWYGAGMMALALLVCASTVLIRQHVLLDIPAGILAAELGLWIARRVRLGRIFVRLEGRGHNHMEQAPRRR